LASREFKDSLWKFTNIAISGGLQFPIAWVLTKLVIPEEYGLYVLVLSILAFVQIFAELGVPLSASRYLTESCQKGRGALNVVRASTGIAFCSGLFFSIVIFVFSEKAAEISGYMQISPLLRIAAGLVILTNMNRLGEELFKGVHEFRIPSVIYCLTKPLQLVLICLFVISTGKISGALMAILLASALTTLLMVTQFYRKYYKTFQLSGDDIFFPAGKIFFYGMPIMIGGVSYFLYTKIDVILLGRLADAREIAVYNVADMVFLIPLVLIAAIVSVTSPHITKEFSAGNSSRIQELFTRVQSLVFFLMIPFSVSMLILSGPFIRIFFPEYHEAIVLLRILAPLLLIKAIGQVTGGFMISMGRAKLLAYWAVIGAILNIILDLLLIPHYKALGAVIGTAVIHGLINLVSIPYFLKLNNLRISIKWTEAIKLFRIHTFNSEKRNIQ